MINRKNILHKMPVAIAISLLVNLANLVSLSILPASAEVADKIELSQPNLKALITISDYLDPFSLDSSSSRNISLPDVLDQALLHNLDVGIRQEQQKSRKWTLASSYGKFLPNINTGFRYQYLLGQPNIPFFIGASETVKLNSPFIITGAGFNYYGYRGGRILYGALANRNLYRASRHKKDATISDVFFESTKRYYDLLLAEAVLHIRIQAVETSVAQLDLNQNLLDGGMATQLDVLQSKTQLSSDRQKLIDQQVERRSRAIELAEYLDLDQGVDLVPASMTIAATALVDLANTPSLLLKAAMANRPELKQFNEERLAARKEVKVSAAPLKPTFQFFGNILGVGDTLSGSRETVVRSLAPVTLGSVRHGLGPLYTLGYSVNWNLEGLGTADLANVLSAKAKSRESLLAYNQEVNTVISQVRKSFLHTLSAHRKREETQTKVESSYEELRLAQLRFQHGVGKNIDILKAQEDYTSAQIEDAQALVAYNVSQARLLHDIGMISVANLTASKPLLLK
jgi:outer membrane protein TolC